MSKMDELRALREARYERTLARAKGRPEAARTVAPPLTPTKARSSSTEAAAAPESAAELCGHRSMNGRTCTREQGHAAKNHRYS